MSQVQASDYRTVILNKFGERLERNPGYSFRAYARDLSFSASHLVGVLRARKGISLKKATDLASRLKLSGRENKLFLASVQALHSRSGAIKTSALQELARASKESDFVPLSMELFDVVSSWFHYAILELWNLKSFQCEPHWIAEALGISAIEADLALARLQRVGLLKHDSEGLLKPAAVTTTAGNDMPQKALRRHHQQILEKAKTAIDSQSTDRRDSSAMTIAVNSSQLDQAKTLIKEFRRRFTQLMTATDEKNAVYCLSIQYFELTQRNS